MCGIVGFSKHSSIANYLPKMLDKISHRGPDNANYFVSTDKMCGIGQVRLSILDISSAGNQPMCDRSQRYLIVYNGEIYNFIELKQEIEEKYSFQDWHSSTDTEIIIEGFAKEGISFIEKLNGIFAIAIFDRKEQTLFVTRDPLGVKPFYYTEQNGGFFFASELKALLSIDNLKRTLRKESLADQLSFMYVPEPFTMFEEFFKLPPGEFRIYRHGQLKEQGILFQDIFSEEISISENEAIEEFQRLFGKAVERQMMSDVPVSAFLSGGLDSSAVLAEARKNSCELKDAYTISFSRDDMRYDGTSDDLHYAKIVADKYGVKLNVMEANLNMLSLLPEVVYHLDDGLADPAAINTYLICKHARENGIKVMLSGQGADEIFGGYRKYLAEFLQ